MKEWKLKKVIQILTACLAMIVVLNVSGISMKTMQTIDINKKESKTNRRDSNLQMESLHLMTDPVCAHRHFWTD